MPFVHDGVRGVADFLERHVDAVTGEISWAPVDAKLAHRQAAARETYPLARYVLDAIVENADLAVLYQRPICGGTPNTRAISSTEYWRLSRNCAWSGGTLIGVYLSAPSSTATTLPAPTSLPSKVTSP